MERRKLLQALTAIPAMVIAGKSGEQIGVKYEVKSDKKYIVFLSPMIDIDSFCRNETALPAGTMVHVVPYGDMDNAIRIYEVDQD